MKSNRSIKTGIAVITIIAILLSTAAIFLSTYIRLADLVTMGIDDHLTDAMNNYMVEVDYEAETAEGTASRLAADKNIADALSMGSAELVRSAVENSPELDEMVTGGNVIVTDINGNVVFRLYNNNSGNSVSSSPSVSEALKGNAVSSIAADPAVGFGAVSAYPVEDENGEVLGAVTVTYLFESNSLIDDIKGDTTNEYSIFLGDTIASTTVTENGSRVIGGKMDADIAAAVLDREEEYMIESKTDGNSYKSLYAPLYGKDDELIGALYCGVLTTEIKNRERSVILTGLLFGLIAVVAASAGIIFYVNKKIVRPLTALSNDTEKVADGDLNVNIIKEDDNEIGILAESVKRTVDSVRGYIDDISVSLDSIASGDMNISITKNYVGDYTSIKTSLEKISDSLNSTLSSIDSAAHQVTSASGQVAQSSQSLSQGAAEQAASIEELADAIHDVAGKVNENAKAAEQAMNSTNDAGVKMQAASLKMDALIAAMNETKECSDGIGRIIKNIEDIAFRTNILALNAAVEAARAGTAGKGFAVVADEVRNLASKSAEAASNTNVLIENTISSVEKGNRLVNEVADMMSAVSEAAGQVAALNTNICDSSNSVADSIKQINTGIDSISGVVQTNSATAEESAAASEELSGQADTLQKQVSKFRLRA